MTVTTLPTGPKSTVRSADFRLLAFGQGLSWLGDAFQPIALAVAIIGVGGSVGELGTVMTVGVIGRLVCTLLGGVWADRLPPQRIMILADLVRAAAVSGIAVMFSTGHRSLPLLCVLVAVVAGAGAFFYPAMSSLKPIVVSPQGRQSANATLTLLQTSSTVVGPATAGLVVAFAGAPMGFAINAATFLISAVSVSLIRVHAPRARRQGLLTEMRQGWIEIRGRDWLLSGVASAGVYHVANGVVLVLVQVVAIRELGGATSVGFISAAGGAGGVLGAVIALRLRPHRLLLAGFATLGLMPVWVISYVWPGMLTGVLVGAFVGFAGLTFFSICWDTALQDAIPHHVLARVSSWDILTSFVGMPVGNALAGPLSSTFGIGPVLVVCAAVMLLAGVAPLAIRSTREARSATAPAIEGSRPHTRAAEGRGVTDTNI
jgi:MFS family permease